MASTGRYASLALESNMLEQNQIAIQKMVDDLVIFHTDSSGSQKYLHFNTATPKKTTEQKQMFCNFLSGLVHNKNNSIKRG